ncbi:hypothetical protein ASF10_17065 [Flavobacterium sp. Leaf82]|nr:hypothetical protein ASF10_17065 [Flavobacterium sp. Leaf82]
MTNGTPQKLGITRTPHTFHLAKGQPLLNIYDKKLSGPFGCKNPAKFWGGLQALCLGIALAAAVVLTGGATLVVIVAACAIGVVSGAVGMYKMAHDCDIIGTAEWKNAHNMVRIDQGNALLNGSYINCSKGGLINIIMDPVIALDAAEQISDNNTKEVLAQMGSMFLIGGISVATAAVAGTASAVISATVAMGMYAPGEWMGEQASNPVVGNLEANASADIATTVATKGSSGVIRDLGVGVTENIANNSIQNITKGAAQYGVGVATESVEMSLEGAVRYTIGKNRFNFSMDKTGVGGLIANIVIGSASDYYEATLAEKTEKDSDRFNKADRNNGINVMAKLN